MMGGLGNQLFQYSFARYLEGLLGEPAWLDILFFLTHKDRRPGLSRLGVRFRKSLGARYAWYRLNSRRFIRWEERGFDPVACRASRGRDMFFWGYWQKAEYARAGREGLLRGFSLFPKRPAVRALAKEILDCDSLSIHVRRGDYRGIPRFALLSKDYYRKALKATDAGNATRWYVFSDEKDLEPGLIPSGKEIVRMAEYGLEDYEEFYLMSLCRRNVAANSTFSWWASFLNEREGRRIVLPRGWMTDPEGFDIQNLAFEDAELV